MSGSETQPPLNGHQSSIEASDTTQADGQHLLNIPTLELSLNGLDNNPERVSIQDRLQATSAPGPIRVPGTYPPEWLPDNEVDSCMSCDNLFTLIRRRHHCRSCGKIFCGECCKQKAKLLYMDNKEARVCTDCLRLIEYAIANPITNLGAQRTEREANLGNSQIQVNSGSQPIVKVQGVLKTVNQARGSGNECNTSSSSSSDQQANKQVVFSDGVRPGADLTESFAHSMPSSSNPLNVSSLLTRQSRISEGSSKRSHCSKTHDKFYKHITVYDELGYLPPIVISRKSAIASGDDTSSSNSLTNLITSQFKQSGTKKDIKESMESRECLLNGIVKFGEISGLVGVEGVITFLLLKDFYLKVKIVEKECCLVRDCSDHPSTGDNANQESISESEPIKEYWSFASEGLSKYVRNEVILILDKDKDDHCVPRDVFKIFLTLHELALRRQSIENFGNLLFQDGLFGNRDTAGIVFVRPLASHCLKNLVLPTKSFLIALVLQRWEVPWSKVFPVRLLLRLGHKSMVFPYPVISFRTREPVYYEVGHTIISILGDFRNFRYSITHVEGLRVMLNKTTRKVSVCLHQSSYQQFNKVLDSSNNEHVLAWSACPFPEADGHLVAVQNEEGHYDSVEFYKKSLSDSNSESEPILGASFIIFSGSLKVDQSGQSAKISIVEDGLLIQIQSCTMLALKNAIHFMHHFDIDCESEDDALNRVEVSWQPEDT